jgi:hypothetical protein
MSAASDRVLHGPMTTAKDAGAGPRRSAKIVRVLVQILLAAAVVRSIGAGVGNWAEGSLSVTTTLLVGIVLPAWLLVFLPTWLAWRVLRPLGLRRAVKACLWLSPLVNVRDLESIVGFAEVLADRPFPDSRTVDAWTALALTLQAERRHDRARAERILDAFTHLPHGSRMPLLARVYGVEALAFAAVEREDWALALRYTRIGEGRLNQFLAAFARAELGEPVRPLGLFVNWALAPKRLATLRRLRAVIARQAKPARPIPPPVRPESAPQEASVPRDPRQRHMEMLGTVVHGGNVQMHEVLALTDAWQGLLDGVALAGLQARALELDAHDGAGQAQALRKTILEELTAMALVADGNLPTPVEHLHPATGSGRQLADEVLARLKEHLHKAAVAAVKDLAVEQAAALDVLAAWERWLVLRSSLDRLGTRVGEDAVAMLWHSHVRNSVWSFTCALFDRDHGRAAWAAHMMFSWLAERAECMDDMQAMLLNRENARIAERTFAWS